MSVYRKARRAESGFIGNGRKGHLYNLYITSERFGNPTVASAILLLGEHIE